MKNIFIFSIILSITFFSCNKDKNTGGLDTNLSFKSYYGGIIDITGSDFDPTRIYDARMGGSDPFDVRVINSELIEIVVPNWAKSGDLSIRHFDGETVVGQVEIARLFTSNTFRHKLLEVEIGTGKTVSIIKDFVNLTIQDVAYSKNTNEIVASLAEGSLGSSKVFFYKYSLKDATEVLEEAVARQIEFDDSGKLFGTVGEDLVELSLDNGSIIRTVGQFGNRIGTLAYFPKEDEMRGYWTEIDSEFYESYHSQKMNLSTGVALADVEQEFDFYEVRAKSDGSYLASVNYQGIIEYDETNFEDDRPVVSDRCCLSLDCSEEWELFIATYAVFGNNGEISILKVKDGQTGITKEYDNVFSKHVVIAEDR